MIRKWIDFKMVALLAIGGVNLWLIDVTNYALVNGEGKVSNAIFEMSSNLLFHISLHLCGAVILALTFLNWRK